MNIVVIGLGSMGKRRIRLIREIFPDYVCLGVDSREDRRNEAKSLYGIECRASIDEIRSEFLVDSAFVCTSPLSHSRIIRECLGYGWNVFTELNLVSDGYEENMALAEQKGVVLFMSSTFFYREEIRYIRGKIDDSHKWNYVYHIGQYLPDWHPWENYKDFFVGDKKTNGCREIMAIELPWLTKTFGEVTSVHVISDKITGLKIDYNDNYLIQIEHENGNKGVLVVDVVSPAAVRRLEVYTEGKYLQWSGTPDSLFEFDEASDGLKQVTLNEKEEHKDGYRAFVVENAYKNEIREFMDVVLGKKKQVYGFKEDLKILKLIEQIGA